jgi:transcriptional regulator with XRE-family HTH domain
MKPTQKKMLATLVKEGRIAKGYTQKELSELTNISTRSIQRIENGELKPRLFTVKALSKSLGFSLEEIPSEIQSEQERIPNATQRKIISVGSGIFILLLAWAFIAQSNRFPDTHFEGILFFAGVLLFITLIQFVIWRTKE